MTGHIGLGAPGDEREYLLRDPKGFDRSAANPFAARVNTNEQYGDLEGWSEMVWENWQTGITREPDEGGTWYSEVETRFRNRLFLTPSLIASGLPATGTSPTKRMAKPYTQVGLDTLLPIEGEITLNVDTYRITLTDHVIAKVAMYIGRSVAWSLGTINGIWVRLKSVVGASATITINANSTQSDPEAAGTAIGTATVSCDANRPGYAWFYAPLDTPYTGTPTDSYMWVTIEATTPGQPLVIPYTGETLTYGKELWYSSTDSSWHFQGDGYQFDFLIDASSQKLGTYATDVEVDHIIEFNNALYASAYTQLYKWDSVNTVDNIWIAVGSALGQEITSLAVWDGELWIGQGNSTNVQIMTSGESFSAGSVPGRLISHYMGYLYRTVANDLYYSSDGTTWSGPHVFGSDDYAIRGIATASERTYVATDDGLYYLAPGDFPTGIQRWDTLDSRNGQGMVSGDDGSIYIPLVNQLMRLDQYGAMTDIWLGYTEGLPSDIIGDIATVFTVFGQVWALVKPPAGTTSPSTVWAFNGQGWHNVTAFPQNISVSSIGLDYDNKRVAIGSEEGYIFILRLPTYGINPLNDTTFTYAASAWFEQNKFFGGWMDLYKDFESVFITGQNLSATENVKVYWQDEASTGWELLGTVTSDMQELRWSDYTTRPASRWIKLGYLLTTGDVFTSPVIEAIRLKFHVNVNDRFSWPMDIIVSDDQAMINGTKNTQTAAQMLTHLDSLSQQTAPVIFRDTDGVRYECKVTTHRRRILEYDWMPQSAAARVTYVYSLVLDQVNTDVYTP